MTDLDPWKKPELHRLAGQRIGARNHRLARDDRRRGREADKGQQQRFRNQQEKRIDDGGRIGEHERALSKIVEQERRQYQKEPCGLNWFASKMPEIRIERFRPGHDEKHRAKRDQAHPLVVEEKHERIVGIDGRKDRWIIEDVYGADDRHHQEPQQCDRPEEPRDLRRAARLNRE